MDRYLMAIDVALGDGVSAAAMSRTVRKLLNNPTALFRRVRDKNGQLRLSQNAKNYHPGRGVYRSAYRNALRLTATETNMAYRTAIRSTSNIVIYFVFYDTQCVYKSCTWE